jgi:hypothetical protein
MRISFNGLLSSLGLVLPAALFGQLTPTIQRQTLQLSPYQQSKLRQLQSARAFRPAQTATIPLVSNPTEVVDVSNVAKYPQASKQPFTPAIVNASCNALPVNYKSSQQVMGLFFPARNFRDAIFPGAVYRFGGIKDQSPVPYTRFTNRNAMDLSTDIFDPRVSNNEPTRISRFDFGTVDSHWKNLLSRYIGGATPADVVTEVILVESNSQMNSVLGTASQVDVGVKLSAPIPKVPVTVDASNKVTVTNTSSLSQSSESQRNTVILRFRQVFYSARMSYRAGNEIDVFPGVDKAQLEDDLVYVYSVDYGQMFYVVISAEFDKETMFNAVMSKVSTQTSLGATAIGMPIKGSVTVGTSNQTSSQFNSVFSSSSLRIQSFQYGGQPIPLGTSMDEVLANLRSKINTRFDASNLGAPIGYTLNFVRDHSPAWVNTNISYATANCGTNLASRRYDVHLTLEKFTAPKVVDTDNNEDLFGRLYLDKFLVNGQVRVPTTNFWNKNGLNYDEFPPSDNSGITKVFEGLEKPIRIKRSLGSGLTNADVKSGEIFVGGFMRDKEVLGDRRYVCSECDGTPRQIKISSYATQIDQLEPGQTAKLKIGADQFFELNFYEDGKRDGPHVKTFWSIEITVR